MHVLNMLLKFLAGRWNMFLVEPRTSQLAIWTLMVPKVDTVCAL